MVLDQAGQLVARLVCLECFKRTVAIVVPAIDAVQCTVCAQRPASTCAPCVNDAAHAAAKLVVKPFAEHFRKQAKAYELAGDEPHETDKAKARQLRAGRVIGLLQAAEWLEAISVTQVPKPDLPKKNGKPGPFEPMSAAEAFGDPRGDYVDEHLVDGRELLARVPKTGPIGDFYAATAAIAREQGQGVELRPVRPPLELKSARVLLALIADRQTLHQSALSRRELAIRAKYTIKGSNMRNGLGALRSAGYIAGPNDQPTITDAGAAIAREAGGVAPSRTAGAELVAEWKAKVKGLPARMLDALVSMLPAEPSRQQLAAELGVDPDGSSYRNAIGRLRSLQLVSKTGQQLARELAQGWQS
jgi:hypothetical protein